ncbi:MAG: TetR/AcrR family transcriptional regulator [Clostridia bacterium]|nr:TetR/AcrR family transcriptional regulator [Clostridia bacterium]
MNKNESKYFNTAIKMDEALISLLEKKDFEYITIREICDTAGVNRSTFYLHYENTSDLLKETTRYIIDKHLAYYEIDKQRMVIQFENCRREELLFITDKYLRPYLTFIKDNQCLFKVSIKQFNSLNMDEVYGRMYKHIFNPILDCFHVPDNERAYVMKFYLTGIFAVVMEWLDNNCADDMETVAGVITDCVMGERNVNG